MIPIIDTHQHLWDVAKVRPPWLPDSGPLAGSHTMADYVREAEGLGIAKTIYMEVAVRPEDQVREAELVIELCRRPDNPMVAAVIGGRPADAGFGAYLARFRGSRYVKGVRQIVRPPECPPGYALREDFVRGVRLLGEAGLCFSICMAGAALPEATTLCEQCPDTRFVLDHCGDPDLQARDRSAWERDIAAIARRPNVICKISGIVASAAPDWKPEDLAPYVRRCADVFGRDRIMFASDWPVCTTRSSLRQWVEALQVIVADWPEADRRRLFHDNAARWFGIGG
jgi:predicted TIM-barrel fold metal-dependent hydrolase